MSAVLSADIATCRGLIVCDKDAPRNSPSRSVGGKARRAPTLDVALDVRFDDMRPHIARRDACPPIRAGRMRALRIRPDRGDGDRWMRLLQGTHRNAHADVPIERF